MALDTMSDDEAARTMAEELRRKGAMAVSFNPITVFQFAGLIQLALRHPHLSDNLRDTAESFLAGVRKYFADAPVCLDVVQRGDDPSQDRPPEPLRGPRTTIVVTSATVFEVPAGTDLKDIRANFVASHQVGQSFQTTSGQAFVFKGLEQLTIEERR